MLIPDGAHSQSEDWYQFLHSRPAPPTPCPIPVCVEAAPYTYNRAEGRWERDTPQGSLCYATITAGPTVTFDGCDCHVTVHVGEDPVSSITDRLLSVYDTEGNARGIGFNRPFDCALALGALSHPSVSVPEASCLYVTVAVGCKRCKDVARGSIVRSICAVSTSPLSVLYRPVLIGALPALLEVDASQTKVARSLYRQLRASPLPLPLPPASVSLSLSRLSVESNIGRERGGGGGGVTTSIPPTPLSSTTESVSLSPIGMGVGASATTPVPSPHSHVGIDALPPWGTVSSVVGGSVMQCMCLFDSPADTADMVSAVWTGRRIVVSGHKHRVSTVSLMVLGLAGMLCSDADTCTSLYPLAERCFPYVGLSEMGCIGATNSTGSIIGVTNPMLCARASQDMHIDIHERKITTTYARQPSSRGILDPSLLSGLRVTVERLFRRIQPHVLEVRAGLMKGLPLDPVHYEAEMYIRSSLTSLLNSVYTDVHRSVAQMQDRAGTLTGARGTLALYVGQAFSYRCWSTLRVLRDAASADHYTTAQDVETLFRGSSASAPPKRAQDTVQGRGAGVAAARERHTDRDRERERGVERGLDTERLAALLNRIDTSLQTDADLRVLVSLCPRASGGLGPIALCLMHSQSSVRYAALSVLSKLDKSPIGNSSVGHLNTFLLLTYERMQQEVRG
ncbi:hypothetical protein KIPB_005254 [Kipferlia bialata]|uniref:UDENN domain-containing protein n=1 Tax=Kipferlia bialata TaxID=797122 RepID=A0A9K3CV30_9EUKA|nr:hypothetical protein KIPB_005254 [Kipferlia bialata]|eukprot:g5254.t1